MTTPAKVEVLIGQAIECLVDDSPERAAVALREMAELMSQAGYGEELFVDTRKRIILLAQMETDALFIQEKLKIAEQDLWQKMTLNKDGTLSTKLMH